MHVVYANISATSQTQIPAVVPIAPEICTGRFSNMLNPNLRLDLLSGHFRHTNFRNRNLVSTLGSALKQHASCAHLSSYVRLTCILLFLR